MRFPIQLTSLPEFIYRDEVDELIDAHFNSFSVPDSKLVDELIEGVDNQGQGDEDYEDPLIICALEVESVYTLRKRNKKEKFVNVTFVATKRGFEYPVKESVNDVLVKIAESYEAIE